MNRQIFFILIILITGGLYLQAMHLNESVNHVNINSNDTANIAWTERLVDSYGIPAPAFNMAINSYHELKSRNLVQNDSLLTIIDFSRPSVDKRLFILDLKNKEIIKNTLVAHGKKSGFYIAESFSNKKSSNKSSLGLYLTGKPYSGKHGYSLRLNGMSKGFNDNVFKRAVVIHGANYVSENYIKRNGRIGRSFGCPALPVNETKEIIDLIKNGSCLFIYHPSLIPISQEALGKLP